jgi:pectate lyase
MGPVARIATGTLFLVGAAVLVGSAGGPRVRAAAVTAAAAGPRYEGFGAATRGGDGSPEVAVTSLEDAGPGTLRAALQGGNRKIVFRVGGSIQLAKALVIEQPNITLDGASAPSPGITIRERPLAIQDTHDVILRYLRLRDSNDDNLRLSGQCRNIVIDHCSSTGAGDGGIDITRDYHHPEHFPRDVTVSWCLIAGTDKAMLLDTAANLSLHHNLFSGNNQRNPQLHNVQGFDLRNNVVRRWGSYGVRVRAGSTGNIVNNVFGPSSNPGKRPDAALIVVAGADPAGKVYVDGNLGPGGYDLNKPGTLDQAPAAPAVATLPAARLEAAVLTGAGARPLDAIDQAFVRR